MIRVRPPLFSPFFTFAYHACASLFDLDPLWILRIKMQIKAKLASAWALDFYLNVCIFDSFNSFAPPLDRHHSIVNSNCFSMECAHTLFITFQPRIFATKVYTFPAFMFFMYSIIFPLRKPSRKFCDKTKFCRKFSLYSHFPAVFRWPVQLEVTHFCRRQVNVKKQIQFHSRLVVT